MVCSSINQRGVPYLSARSTRSRPARVIWFFSLAPIVTGLIDKLGDSTTRVVFSESTLSPLKVCIVATLRIASRVFVQAIIAARRENHFSIGQNVKPRLLLKRRWCFKLRSDQMRMIAAKADESSGRGVNLACHSRNVFDYSFMDRFQLPGRALGFALNIGAAQFEGGVTAAPLLIVAIGQTRKTKGEGNCFFICAGVKHACAHIHAWCFQNIFQPRLVCRAYPAVIEGVDSDDFAFHEIGHAN